MFWAIAARQDARFLVFDFGCGTLDVVTDRSHICLNRDNPAFIVADPPFQRDRDTERLICAFRVVNNLFES